MCRDNIYQYVYQNNTITIFRMNVVLIPTSIKDQTIFCRIFKFEKKQQPWIIYRTGLLLYFWAYFKFVVIHPFPKKTPFFKNLPPNNIRVFFENFSPLVTHIFDKPSMTFKGAVSLLRNILILKTKEKIHN